MLPHSQLTKDFFLTVLYYIDIILTISNILPHS